MSYEVLVDNLRSAAGQYRTVAGSLGTDGVDITHVDPSSFGHVELAAWVKAVGEQCDNATQALHDGATGLADSLGVAATHYETTDDSVGQIFQQPFGDGLLGSPFGQPPVYGPPAPGGGR
jgi:hypothetical protein